MAYKSTVSNDYIKVEEIGGDEAYTRLNINGVYGDDGFKSEFNLSHGTLTLERDEPCRIDLNNIDEGDRTWTILGPNLSGELHFVYTSS